MTTFVNDSYTGTDNSLLTAHVGETGASWTAHASWTGSNRDCVLASNRIRPQALNVQAVLYASGSPAGADVVVTGTLYVASLTTESEQAGITARLVTSSPSGYMLRYLVSAAQWQIVRLTATNANTLIGSFAQTLAVGQSYLAKLQVVGSQLTAFVDGTQIIQVTDSNITASGRVGIYMSRPITTPTNTTGLQWDSFSAADYVPPAPTNTVAPGISGTAQDGQSVSCSTGTWTDTPTSYSYQWKRNGVNISGATSSTYVIVTADVGQTVVCTVTATNAGGSTSADSNSITPTAAGNPPANTVAPAITGSAVVGQTVSVSTGTWTNSPTSYSYQWLRNGSPISGATANTYQLQSADAGTSVLCTVTALNAYGSTSANSNTITPTIPAPSNNVLPVVTGVMQVSQTLISSSGGWTNSPISYTYQWVRDGSDIVGATTSSYVLTVADSSHLIACRVTAVNAGGSGSATSSSHLIYPAAAPGLLDDPVITGTAQTGQQVFSSTGDWSGNPSSFTYQWTRDGVNISGATSPTYTCQVADEGHALRCVVTAYNGTFSQMATSNALVPVPAGTIGTVVFLVQMPTSGLVGTIGLEVIDPATENVLIGRSTANIDEVIAGSGLYRALRVTEPPSGALLVWDDGSQTAGHIAATRY